MRKVRGLYAITDERLTPPGRLLERVAQAIKGGAAVIQYRSKNPDQALRRREALELCRVCGALQVPFIVNDDVDLALDIGASGVHLGRDDAGVQAARGHLGRHAIIGASCYGSLERAAEAEESGADYVAFGSFFPSPTKPQALRAPVSLLREARIRLSVSIVAIGGIEPANAPALLEAGADALAVVHGIFGEISGQSDPEAAARRYALCFRQRARTQE
jgi:thiamine-phosphate pyrophosphorylase